MLPLTAAWFPQCIRCWGKTASASPSVLWRLEEVRDSLTGCGVEKNMNTALSWERWQGYGVAAAAVVMAGFLRVLLQPALGHEYEFTTFFLAVVWAAWKGGFGPAVFALVLDCIVAGAIHGFRNESVIPSTASDATGLLLYIIMGLSVAILGEAQRHSLTELTLEAAKKEQLIGQLASEVSRRESAQAELLKSQQEMVQINQSLEERVSERTNELRMAMDELESFTYSMAHDIRAPLRAVNSTCRLIAAEHEGKIDSTGMELLNSAMRAAEFMNSFVDDLLDYTRLGRAPIRKKNLDLTLIIESISTEMVGYDRAVEIDIQPGMAIVSDHYMTVSLFQELLDNALKFKKPDLPCKVDVRMWAADDGDIITVSDTGIGFEQEYASKVFEPFQKLHGFGKYTGTGIGLAKAKRIVERMGGRIWAEAVLSQGCKVYVLLPHRFQRVARDVEPETIRLMAAISE